MHCIVNTLNMYVACLFGVVITAINRDMNIEGLGRHDALRGKPGFRFVLSVVLQIACVYGITRISNTRQPLTRLLFLLLYPPCESPLYLTTVRACHAGV